MASRYSLMLHFCPVPDHLFVLHSCDNPLCVEPAHLRLGDVQMNSEDSCSRGRQAKGNGHGKSKLTEDIVREIKATKRPFSIIKMAVKLGVNYYAIRDVLTSRTWRHVQ